MFTLPSRRLGGLIRLNVEGDGLLLSYYTQPNKGFIKKEAQASLHHTRIRWDHKSSYIPQVSEAGYTHKDFSNLKRWVF